MAFTEVADAGAVTASSPGVFEVGGRKVAVFRVGGALHAIDPTCPHQGGNLAEGEVEDGAVVCPLHRWKFELGTGACKTRDGFAARTYAVKEEGGKIMIEAGDEKAAGDASAAPTPREVKAGSGFGFLARNRNDVTKNLLGFLGASGKNLDPKTKYLIYCAMQTVTFSPRGLRQYIPKAIKAGASEDEVVDAILQAYPGAGLGKVVEALDVFLSLGYGGDLEG